MKTPGDPIKIIIADDHEIVREGFARIIQKYTQMKIVAEASNGLQLLQLIDQYIPEIILVDIKMPFMDGIEATAIITKKYPGIGIIALSMFDDDQFILDMLEAGAKGYLLKNADKHEIIEAIETVNKSDTFFCKSISVKMVKLIAESPFNKKRHNNKVIFTLKEKQVIDLICRQFFTKEISAALHLSPRTIEGYREVILKKMNARNSVGILLYAIANNLFEPANTENSTR